MGQVPHPERARRSQTQQKPQRGINSPKFVEAEMSDMRPQPAWVDRAGLLGQHPGGPALDLYRRSEGCLTR